MPKCKTHETDEFIKNKIKQINKQAHKVDGCPARTKLQADEFILGTQHTTHQQVKSKKRWNTQNKGATARLNKTKAKGHLNIVFKINGIHKTKS